MGITHLHLEIEPKRGKMTIYRRAGRLSPASMCIGTHMVVFLQASCAGVTRSVGITCHARATQMAGLRSSHVHVHVHVGVKLKFTLW